MKITKRYYIVVTNRGVIKLRKLEIIEDQPTMGYTTEAEAWHDLKEALIENKISYTKWDYFTVMMFMNCEKNG